MVLYHQNSNHVPGDAKVDAIWETPDGAAADAILNYFVSSGIRLNALDGPIDFGQKLGTEAWYSACVESCCVNDFDLGLLVINHPHSMFFLADWMTSL